MVSDPEGTGAGAVGFPQFPTESAVIGGEVKAALKNREVARVRATTTWVNIFQAGGGGAIGFPEFATVGGVGGGEVDSAIVGNQVIWV